MNIEKQLRGLKQRVAEASNIRRRCGDGALAEIQFILKALQADVNKLLFEINIERQLQSGEQKKF